MYLNPSLCLSIEVSIGTEKLGYSTQISGEIYVGLLDKIVKFMNEHGYDYEFENSKFYGTPYEENEMVSLEGVSDYMRRISKYEPRPYQVQGVYDALRQNRRLLISPTDPQVSH